MAMSKGKTAVLLSSLLLGASSSLHAEIQCELWQFTDEVNSEFHRASLSLASPWFVMQGEGWVATGEGNDIFLGNRETGTRHNLTQASGQDFSPTISGDGSRIVFASRVNHTGENPDGNAEIMLLDRSSGELRQITHTAGELNAAPRISADGSSVFFRSANQLVDWVPPHTSQYYLYDVDSESVTLLTHLTTWVSGYMIDPEHRWFVFASPEDLLGENPEGNVELYLSEIETGTLSQLTHTVSGFNHRPWISSGGERIAFISESEEYVEPGGFGDLVVYEKCRDTFRQITRDGAPQSLRISADGKRVGVNSSYQVQVYDLATGAAIELGWWLGSIGFGSTNADGTVWSILSEGDLLGENPDGSSEVFLATCTGLPFFADGFECGDTSAWSRVVPRAPQGR